MVRGTFLLLSALLLTGCAAKVKQPAAKAAEVADESEDAFCQELLDCKDEIAEARDWLDLRHKNHMMWKVDRETTLKLVNDLYAAGAAIVHVVITPEPFGATGVQICGGLVVTLPTDRPARKKVFKVYKDFWEDHEDYRVKDQGQKYLHVDLDP
jgi:hypothetical protein